MVELMLGVVVGTNREVGGMLDTLRYRHVLLLLHLRTTRLEQSSST